MKPARRAARLLWETPSHLFFRSHRESLRRSRWGRPKINCGSDPQRVRVKHVNVSSRPLTSNRRHTGPVWQVAWAHPKYGHILASCSYDGKVLIWKEQPGQGAASGGWIKIKEHTLHTASGAGIITIARLFGLPILPVNSVSWAPHELGAILACASSDGKLSVLTFKSTSLIDHLHISILHFMVRRWSMGR